MLQVFLSSTERSLTAGTSLRRVVCSGEALPADLKDRFLGHMTGVELHNLYGPTEAAVDVTATQCHQGGETTSVSIGRPVSNTQIYVLARDFRAVPVSVGGELHIGGVQLARLYLNRPELTAEKFIPNPFADQPGGRLYRTGDLSRYRPDGNIEFLGRLDFQVKIRGFRIELGEIEAVLAQYPSVREALVLAREDDGDAKRLVAYLTHGADTPAVPDLRNYLKDRLPEYMVPAAFVLLETFPLNPNGKVDRRALPAPERTWQRQWSDDADSLRPSTEAEISIARVWRSVLLTDDIGLDDKFFDLGGHSLSAIQVMTRLEGELGYQVKFNDLLFQTLRQMAAACEKQSAGA
jgi:acyl-CoA synthetase (AMP-forming)/AMP-acid ligase II/acyl carrier protein